MTTNAEQLIDLIREIVREEVKKQDNTVPCIVDSVNDDGTVNLCILPDLDTVINRILNPNHIDCREGDTVLLYKVKRNWHGVFMYIGVAENYKGDIK